MYSTGNYTQYPTINTMEKNMKKRMYTCVQLSHFAVEQRLAQHCKSTILELKKKWNKEKQIVPRGHTEDRNWGQVCVAG